MPNDNSTMGERFRQSFGNYWSKIPQGNTIGFVDLDDKRPIVLDIESVIAFIQSEIGRAVGEERRNVIDLLVEIDHKEIAETYAYTNGLLDYYKSLITKQS